MEKIAKPSISTKFAYGFGAIAFGVKNNGFDYFLLTFYSIVLGVDAPLVGLALLIALVVDSISDPIVGYLSDNTKSKWGRRHPWMYAAAIPVAVCYYFLWSPPDGLTGNDLFPYLVTISIAVRLLVTFYEIPSSALAAEITKDYDERTTLLSYRMSFGWIAGTLMAVFVLSVLLVPTETIPNGFLNKDAYGTYGLIAACIIGGAILITSIGTHKLIPSLPKASNVERQSIGTMFKDFKEAMVNKAFASLLAASVMSSIIIGMVFGLNITMNTYFWGLTTEQISLLNLSFILAALLSFFFTPRIAKRFGKRNAVITIGIVTMLITPILVTLKLNGALPSAGDPNLLYLLFTIAVIDVAIFIAVQTIMYSMIAEMVEQNEVETGKRSEGIYFSAISFTRKASHGLGVMAAAMVISIANFPKGAAPSDVSVDSIESLGITYAAGVVVLWAALFLCLKFFKLDRETHAENLAILAAKSNEGS